jgi:hypothetical protein
MACQGIAASDFMNSIRPEAYKRLKDFRLFEAIFSCHSAKGRMCVVWPCAMAGRKSVSGTLILHDSASSFVTPHELGHNILDQGTGNFLRCENAAYDGAWSDTCKAVEIWWNYRCDGNVDTTSPLNTIINGAWGILEDSQIDRCGKARLLI